MRFTVLALLLVACSDDSNVRTPPDAPELPADATQFDAPTDAPDIDAMPDAPPLVCTAGTADCDGDGLTCETNTNTDALHCGRCDRACGGTSTCSAGLCSAQLILDPTSTTSNYCGTAFTADQLFTITCWGSNFSELRRAPIDGSNPAGTQVAQYTISVVAVRGILVDGDRVYWGVDESPSHVYSYKTDGTEAVGIGFTDIAGMRFGSLQLVGDTYYWIDNTYSAPGEIAPSSIMKRAKTDTSATVLVSGLANAGFLQVTSTKLVWTDTKTATDVGVYSAPLAGAADPSQITLVAATAPGTHLTKIGDVVYWADKKPQGAIRRWDSASASPTVQDVATGLASPEGIITDATSVYFKQADAMYRVASAGGTPVQLSPSVAAHDTQATEVLHTDASYVYWVAGPGFGDSKIYRVAK